jgi:hypothetical protein
VPASHTAIQAQAAQAPTTRNTRTAPSSGKDGARGSGASKDDKCHYCGKKGQWARECRKKKRDEETQAHHVQNEDEANPALLMAVWVPDNILDTATSTHRLRVYLNEERAHMNSDANTVWFLDTGAPNHMTGDAAAFAELDERISAKVKFGDGSLVDIHGCGTVLFAVAEGQHRAFTGVYWIPRLRSNIISIGQLDEIDCPTHVEGGFMTVHDKGIANKAHYLSTPGAR